MESTTSGAEFENKDDLIDSASRLAEMQFKEMTQYIREVLWLFDLKEKRMLYASPAYEQIWGKSIERLYVSHDEWFDCIHPDDVAFALKSFQRIVETGVEEPREYRIVRPDGTVRWISDRGFAIKDKAGDVMRIAGIAEDVTERHKAVEENRKRQKYLESVLFHAPDAIITLGPDHHVIDWNPGAVNMFGYSREEAFGKNLDDLVAQGPARIEAGIVTRKVFTDLHVDPFETIRFRKDGTPINVIAAGSAIIINDRINGVVAVYTDISALKKVEQALRESDEQMRAVFNTIPEPVALIRLEDGCITNVNEAFVETTGMSREDVIGKTYLDAKLWEDPAQRAVMVKKLKKSGEVKNFEASFKKKDNRTYDGLFSARVININDIPHYISSTRDISALKAAQAEKQYLETQLRQAQKMEAVGTLAGGIAHDFNNLLMGIQGRNSLMIADASPNSPFFEHLQEIDEYVRRATDLAQQLLGFARGGKYEVRVLDLNTLITESLSLFGRTHKEIDIQTQCDKQLWPVEADRSQIEQVLLNLFVNSWQAMPENGTLRVETRNILLGREVIEAHGVTH